MHDTATPSDPGSYNAFAPDFRELFGQRDEPASAAEADLDGPWEVRRTVSPREGERFTIWRCRERAARGDRPAADFDAEATAILACALRPLLGRDPVYVLGGRREDRGFPVSRGGEASGWLELFEESWIAGLNLLERIVRSPDALAMLLEAAGPLALERAGKILLDRVVPDEPAEPVQ